MDNQEKKSQKKHAAESTESDEKAKNIGAVPVKSAADGRLEGEAKQRKST